MNCKFCGSDLIHKNGHERNGDQKYHCRSCKRNFITKEAKKTNMNSIGMTLSEFRAKHDVDYIVTETLKKLSKDIIYEKGDVYKLTGLRPGYPGLAATLEDKKYADYRGKIGGVYYWSHPDTIKELINDAILQ